MNIILAKSAGFCFGVKRAVETVYKEAGMVVHPGAGNFHGTLIQAVAWHLRDMPEFDANQLYKKEQEALAAEAE